MKPLTTEWVQKAEGDFPLRWNLWIFCGLPLAWPAPQEAPTTHPHFADYDAERVTEWLRMCLRARREGKCDGVVTYCLDKQPRSRVFHLARELFREFQPPARYTGRVPTESVG